MKTRPIITGRITISYFLTRKFLHSLSANVAAFLTRGKGYYEEYENNAPYADYGIPDPRYRRYNAQQYKSHQTAMAE